MAELDRVRVQGHALNDQEVELGLRSLAVPLMTARGRVVAAANIGLAVASLPGEEILPRLRPPLMALQAELRGLLH